jgi:hypothetical protein
MKPFTCLENFLYYRHQDYRIQKPHRRLPYDKYVQFAKQAEQLNSNNTSQKKHCVHGIQGMWYWTRLQYADLETQFTWPLVHAISGVVVKVLKLIINDHYQKGYGSKIVHHNISKVRALKEKNRQQVRGAAKGTKAKEDEENKEDDCENEEGGHAPKRVTRRTKLIRFQLRKRGDFDLHMKNEKPPIKYFQKLTPIVFKHG